MICTTNYCLGDMGPAPLLDPPDWDSQSIESRFTEESKVAFDTQVSLHWKDTYINPFKVMQSNKFLLTFLLKFMKVLVLTWMWILMFLLKIGRTFKAWCFQADDFPKDRVAWVCCASGKVSFCKGRDTWEQTIAGLRVHGQRKHLHDR